MPGYGALSGAVSIGEHELVIEKRGRDVIEYRRKTRGKLEVSRLLYHATRLELLPMYPVLIPRKITTYVLVKLNNPLAVPPRREIDIYVKIPIDTAVYAYGSLHRFLVVDTFTIHRVKYYLYGPPDRGVVARYAESGVYMEKPQLSFGEAAAYIHVRNRHDSWVEIGLILLDAQTLKLYYEPGTGNAYTQYISFVANSAVTASVYYGRRISPGYKPILDPPDLKPPRLLAKTEMLWGLQ